MSAVCYGAHMRRISLDGLRIDLVAVRGDDPDTSLYTRADLIIHPIDGGRARGVVCGTPMRSDASAIKMLFHRLMTTPALLLDKVPVIVEIHSIGEPKEGSK